MPEIYPALVQVIVLVATVLIPLVLGVRYFVNLDEEKVVEIRKSFRLADALWSLLGILVGFAITFVTLSDCFPLFLNPFRHCIDFWFIDCANSAGPVIPVGEDWIRVKYFLAAAAAATFAVPLGLMFGTLYPEASLKIAFTDKYIKFPRKFFRRMRFRTKRKWKELLGFQVTGESESEQMVKFNFRGGATVSIPRSDFSEFGLNQILHAVATRAPSALGVMHASDESCVMDIPISSYTELWDADFQRHFRSTTFVPLQPGASLQGARFEIVSQLATTAMSATYVARMKDGSKVVLKESVSAHDSESGRKAKEMFLKECQHLSTLDHPSIAKVIDSFAENNRCYLALQFIPGKDLYQRVKNKGAVAENDVLNWAAQICETLIYLHDQDPPIIHRDLTPHNLVLNSARKIHVIDFGAANRFQANVTGTMIGKQCYMAPEQLRGKSTPQSDLYSLGATMYFLLTGVEPEPLSVCSPKLVNQNLSDETNCLIEALTSLDTTERIADAREAHVRIQQLMDESSIKHSIDLTQSSPVDSMRIKVKKREAKVADAP